MDVHAKIAQLRQTVDEARSMPMSASVVVNRGELLALVAEGRQEADGIVADAHREREKLISDTDVFRVAKREADGLVARAREDAEALRQETDQYVDAKLANFEVTLGRTSDAVRRGRERLAGRSSFADLRDPDPSLEDPAWEPSPDRGDA